MCISENRKIAYYAYMKSLLNKLSVVGKLLRLLSSTHKQGVA